MALRIVEFFGYDPFDPTEQATRCRSNLLCPFLDIRCTKTFRDGSISGVCTVQLAKSGPVICCPNRLYAEQYKILSDVTKVAFEAEASLGTDRKGGRTEDGRDIAVFGKRWAKELRLPKRGGRGAYFVDWILAVIGSENSLDEFVAVEVQSIDTTGSYREERDAYLQGKDYPGWSNAGLNWENVSKRILPQIIYKGHVLRREPLCKKGMFFICPDAVYERITERLGRDMLSYEPQPGSLTFRWYDVGPAVAPGQRRNLIFKGQFTTTVDQVAYAFTAPANLPPPRVYEEAIRKELSQTRSSNG
jgi:hypothetical protein